MFHMQYMTQSASKLQVFIKIFIYTHTDGRSVSRSRWKTDIFRHSSYSCKQASFQAGQSKLIQVECEEWSRGIGDGPH